MIMSEPEARGPEDQDAPLEGRAPPACLVLLQPVVGLSENPPTILPSCAVCTTSTSPRR
jgi:hypothetical protein